MSNTLLCLSEPVAYFTVQPNKTELRCSNSCESCKTEDNIKMPVENTDNYSKETCPLKEIYVQKQSISRKREATNALLECVKRRDNTCHFNVESSVPFQSNIETPLKNSEVCRTSTCDSVLFESMCSIDTSLVADLSDSASAIDSGIDISSKSCSPCHNTDSLLSQDDRVIECSSINMEVDNIDPLPQPSNISNHYTLSNDQSPVPIYEDLHSLHLTDETQAPENNLKPPISESLFKYVAPCIYFATKEEKVGPMPDNVQPFMKWKLSTITPLVIKETVLKSGFVMLDANTPEEWLGTWGKHLKCRSFKRIRPYQKVNHYPGGFHLGRKDKLWDDYKSMQARYGTEAFNFFPETYRLPSDINLLKNVWKSENENCWIVKPPAAARGTGVKVINKWSQIPKDKPTIVQRYLNDPYLINETKFDLRIYVLVSSVEPLRIYEFDDGLVRFASEKYSLSSKSFSNRFVHLTNYSVNKKSSAYTANNDENLCQGHKWTLKTFWSYMSNSGIDVQKIQESITDMIIKTVICTEGPICRLMKTYAKSTYNCYELFGFDIMLDKTLKPWLLEVNISPSLHIRSMLDANVKGHMVKDMLNIVGFQVPEKKSAQFNENLSDYGVLSAITIRHKALRNRCLSQTEKEKHSLYTFHFEKSDILEELTPDDVRCLIESEDEYHRKGSFNRIFPTSTSSKYFVYFEHIRYYNLLLDAWEKRYSSERNEGISKLQELCTRRVHLQGFVKETSQQVEEPEIEITVH